MEHYHRYKNNPTIFKVGQKVECRGRKGTIETVCPWANYPYTIRFEDGNIGGGFLAKEIK